MTAIVNDFLALQASFKIYEEKRRREIAGEPEPVVLTDDALERCKQKFPGSMAFRGYTQPKDRRWPIEALEGSGWDIQQETERLSKRIREAMRVPTDYLAPAPLAGCRCAMCIKYVHGGA